MDRVFAGLAAVSGFLAVALGAFGAHLLRDRLGPDLLSVWQTAQRLHLFHTAALLFLAWAAARWPGPATVAAGWLFIAGLVLFSGSLYALALTGARWLGAVTPFGGAAFLAGWLVLAWRVWSAP
jgi:uncharacterized membrane protein YgdD (TMEM256/DUF423 family)